MANTTAAQDAQNYRTHENVHHRFAKGHVPAGTSCPKVDMKTLGGRIALKETKMMRLCIDICCGCRIPRRRIRLPCGHAKLEEQPLIRFVGSLSELSAPCIKRIRTLEDDIQVYEDCVTELRKEIKTLKSSLIS